MKTFLPVDPKTITKEEQTKEIYSLLFLKEKRYGTVTSKKTIYAYKFIYGLLTSIFLF